MITVQLLGGASLRSGNEPLAGPPVQRHRIALLTLIVSAWPQPLARDRAIALLWPERDAAGARRLLNLAVHVLRAALGDAAIASAGDALLLNPSHIRCDLHELRAAIAAGEPEPIVRHYTGELLEGFHLAESAEFGYWLDQRRSELTHAYTRALLAVGERQERSGDVHGRVATGLRLVAADPHSAAHAQVLMLALDAAGDRAAAIQHANDHARRLRAELELEPDPAVAALAEQLRTAAPVRAATPHETARARARSIAVLPFLHLGDDREHDYFADGITEDVVAQLAKVRALHVIARGSVMSLERHRSLREIGRSLGAATLLDGSVRHAGDRVRVVAALIDVESERHLWGETYDRQLTDIFAIQADVARQIAAALEAELSLDEQSRVRKLPTADFQAYRLYLQGRRRFLRYSAEGSARAIVYFERAIARDPAFALAWASLATACIDLAEIGAAPSDALMARAAEAAATALRLDPDLGAAYTTLGYLQTARDFDWSGAERSFRRAIELSPGDPDAHNFFGRLCAGLGRYDEAMVLLFRAQELDPLAHTVDVVTTLLRAGRYDEALERAEEAAELDTNTRTRATLGWARFLVGRRAEGVAELEQAVAASARNPLWLGQLGEAYAMAGEVEKARAILDELHERARTGYVSPYHFAYVHTGLGEFELALDWLEQAVTVRTGPVHSMKGSFLLAPLRGHPRFEALLSTIKVE